MLTKYWNIFELDFGKAITGTKLVLDIQLLFYIDDWSDEIADLFHQSVHTVSTQYYSAEQKEAWEPTPPDYIF